ncbi:MAG: PD-(D/E)XK nuclease family protein, partial [Oscillospiraceae bacterium]|nr:PD-(D/E)XK nuclease family protein [Oscillospiraceae bacterium]
ASSVISVLRRSGITSQQLMTMSEGLKGKLLDKTLDIASVYHQYETLLAKHDLKDTLTDITEAAAVANGHDYFAGMHIFIDEFESFTPDQYEMLAVIIGLADEVYIAMRMESEHEHELSLFGSVGDACRKIKSIARDFRITYDFTFFKEQHRMKHDDLIRLSDTIFRPVLPEPCGKSEHIHIFEGVSPVHEAEYICAAIKRKLAENSGLRCGDIAVVTNKLPEYAGILEHSMERYGIPYHLDMPKPVLHTPFMVYLMSVMSLLKKRSPDTELLLRCGKSGFTDCSLTEIAKIENYCYIWSVEGKMWNVPFTCGKDSEEAESIRQKLIYPMTRLRELCSQCRTGADYSRKVYEFLTEQNTGTRAAELFEEVTEGRQQQMKQDFKRVWESLMDILDVLAFLYEEQSCTASEYFTMLYSMLRTVSHSVPPRTLDAVYIAPAGTSRLSQPKLTFVAGACDGSFPMNASGSSLFSERDRTELECQGIDIGQPPEMSAADERLAVYKILSSASEELHICYPLKDSGDKKCIRSTVVDFALSLFENSQDMLITYRQLDTSFYAVTKAAAYYHYVQDFSKRNADISAVQTVLYEDEYYAHRIDYLKSVHGDAEFAVRPELMERLTGKSIILTATRLETFRMCPFRYFCKYALKLYERRKTHLGNLETGNLIHACMEKLLKSVGREEFLSMTSERLAVKLHELSLSYWKEMLGGEFQQNMRETASLERITDGMLALAVHMQQEFSQSDFYPEYFEAEIAGKRHDFPSPELMTPSGHRVTINGVADRIDVLRKDNEEWIRVVDYKTGGKKFSLGNLAYGLDMQMLMYLFAVTGEGSRLSGGKPAGVLYLPSGMPSCTLGRNGKKTAAEAIDEQYQMNGLFVDDSSVLRHMDKYLDGKYISAKLLKGGERFAKNGADFLSEKQMEQLRKYAYSKITETAEGIYSGNASVDPLILAGRDACEYCTY